MTNQIKLTQGQQDAADGFFSFLFNEEKEMCISGEGGTGKTFLMGYLIDEILPRYQNMCQMMNQPSKYNEVQMTSTTNKAAEVLSVATGRPTQTIQSFMNLKVTDDYTTGESTLSKSKSWRVHHNLILFVDEASMIDRVLLEFIRSSTCNCKIIYVGDHCQLAPVKESTCPVFNQRLTTYYLTEPKRTDVVALQELNKQLRATVETNEFFPIVTVPGIIDWLDGEGMEVEINNHFLMPHNNRVLAYTNKRVVDYNDYIRGQRAMQGTYTEGEFLINNSAVPVPRGMLSVETEVQVVNLSPTTDIIEIEDGVHLEVRYADLHSSYGDIWTGMALPEDKKHYNELLKYYQKHKRWVLYFKLKNNYPDLRQKDASTIHKVQGSSLDTVFIDLDNLSTCPNPNLAARLLYVAGSRARKRIVFYGDLADKYGGIIAGV